MTRIPEDATVTTEPCRCHQSFAAVTPMHPGHCCFWPENRNCHEREVAEWMRGNREHWART